MRAPASFPLFQSSRKIRRTNCLFSEDISPAPLAQDCITAEQRWEGISVVPTRQLPCEATPSLYNDTQGR